MFVIDNFRISRIHKHEGEHILMRHIFIFQKQESSKDLPNTLNRMPQTFHRKHNENKHQLLATEFYQYFIQSNKTGVDSRVGRA